MSPNGQSAIDLDRHIKAIAPQIELDVCLRYTGGHSCNIPTRLKFHGLRSPTIRHVAKTLKPALNGRETDIWQASNLFETRCVVLCWSEEDVKACHKRADSTWAKLLWKRLKSYADSIDNWPHADAICAQYAFLLELIPQEIYPILARWNAGKNPWLRRISIVSLIYYKQQRQVILPFVKIASLVIPQIKHPHFYVQKGVGWTLREMGTAYPAETKRFLRKHLLDVSATAFTAAIERLPKAEKDILKTLRRNARDARPRASGPKKTRPQPRPASRRR